MDTQPIFHLNRKTKDSWRAKGVLGFEYSDAQRGAKGLRAFAQSRLSVGLGDALNILFFEPLKEQGSQPQT